MVDVCQQLEALASAGPLAPARELLGCLDEAFARVSSTLHVAVPRR